MLNTRSGLALLLAVFVLTLGMAWVADGLIVRLLLDQAADRAADEVQLGLVDRITAQDFITPVTANRLDSLATRLDPVISRLRENGSGIIRVNVIGRDGTILYSDLEAARGRTIQLEDRPELETALSGGIGADETPLGGEENADLRPTYARALEVYVPVRLDGKVAGAYEIYEDDGLLRMLRSLVWAALLACWGVGALVVLAWRRRRLQPAATPFHAMSPQKHEPASAIEANARRQKRVRLTPRELEVLRLMATSHSNRDIAEQLGVSQETVRTHVKRILHKLDQPDRTQAVVAAVRDGLLDLSQIHPMG